MSRLRTGDITLEELGKARSSLRNMRVQSGESLDGLVSDLDAIVTYGLAPDSFANDLGRLDTADLASVNAAARSLLTPDGGVLVLVGEAKSIKAQLDIPGVPAPTVVTVGQFLAGN